MARSSCIDIVNITQDTNNFKNVYLYQLLRLQNKYPAIKNMVVLIMISLDKSNMQSTALHSVICCYKKFCIGNYPSVFRPHHGNYPSSS